MSEPNPRPLCLITGASAGIGAELARVFAGQGWDLALTARRGDRLQALAEELAAAHGVEAFAIPADLSRPGACDAILAAVAAKERVISGLVNNAGYGLNGPFAKAAWSDQADMLQVMLTAVVEMTHKVLPGMTERGHGRILNVASVAGMLPGSPGQTLYTPIKSFLLRFSETLYLETLGSGVHVTALCPGFTYTEFHDVNRTRSKLEKVTPKWMWQDVQTVARQGYAALEANRPVCVTGAPNRAIAALSRLLPDDLALALAAWAQRKIGRPF
jgi:short-subunit dehydrogenase